VSDAVPSNVELKPDTAYALYVGEMKSCPLNAFVREGLARRLGTDFDVVSVVPDVLSGCAEPNVIVINPTARRLSQQRGAPVAFRPSGAEFLRDVSESELVRETVRAILARQDVLYVWMFESRPELALLDLAGVRLLGPEPQLAQRLNGKPWQYETLGGFVPLPEFRVCRGRDELLAVTSGLLGEWTDGLFVSLEHSAGGAQSIIARTGDQVAARFDDAEAVYLVTRYMPHTHDPTVLAVVANARDVFVAGVADQRIEDGRRFTGSTYPSALPAAVQGELREATRRIGRRLGEEGYRGIFGCDFIADAHGGFRLVEVNARKQGTTMEFCCTLSAALPPGAPNLLELEYCAVTRSEFPPATAPPRADGPSVHWGTFNLKALRPLETKHHLPQEMPERDLFRRVAAGGEGGCLFLEHVGAGVQVEPGCFVGRVAAVDSSRAGMLSRLQEGRDRLAHSLAAP
jgi:hypothetical protein